MAAVIAAVALAGCAGKDKKPKLAYEERPVELLYATGADRLDRGQWDQAVQYFEEVERQHPYSEWARRAIMMTAYAHYMGNDYPEAIADAERFISLYPGNPAAAYAHYLKAICYFEQIVDVGRDQGATGQALAALQEVAQRYPNTEYAADARLKIDMVNDQLAGKEMTVGRWYLRNGDTLAAVGRFKTVVDRYQTTSHTPEALYRLVESYLTLGLLEEARRNGAVLGHNYPGDVWYKDAYDLLTDKGLQPATARPSGRFLPRVPLPWGKRKDTTVRPPEVTTAPPPPAAEPVQAAQAAPAEASPAAETPTAAAEAAAESSAQ
ncbi:outer membrane protein assembly factor BamD [Phenylobacterium sp.]|jgi:outer membrane protein assembly factor BamD|uniref:outer membrane protein assembly factor BamD n=1 Tax=Phenylobacterium sp. TaxID=1871053 RepID=UPI0039C99F47